MSGVNLKEMEEDLRQIKNMIEIMKGISFDALHILKRGEDIAYDVRTVLTKLNICPMHSVVCWHKPTLIGNASS